MKQQSKVVMNTILNILYHLEDVLGSSRMFRASEEELMADVAKIILASISPKHSELAAQYQRYIPERISTWFRRECLALTERELIAHVKSGVRAYKKEFKKG